MANHVTSRLSLARTVACSLAFLLVFVSGLISAAEISLEAERHMARGLAAMEDAKSATDYQDAVREFRKAIDYAPDWPDAWYNLGVAQESAAEPDKAIQSFKKYLEKNPQAKDAKDVQKRIFKLEYLHEKAQKKSANIQAKQDDKQKLQRLSGEWRDEIGGSVYQITVSGSSIEIISLGSYIEGAFRKTIGNATFRGTIQSLSVRGTVSIDWTYYKNGRVFERSFTGTIGPNGRKITLDYLGVIATEADRKLRARYIDFPVTSTLTKVN